MRLVEADSLRLSFICSENASLEPARYSASATAASLPDETIRPNNRSLTDTCWPTPRNIRDTVLFIESRHAFSLIVTIVSGVMRACLQRVEDEVKRHQLGEAGGLHFLVLVVGVEHRRRCRASTIIAALASSANGAGRSPST